MVSGIDGLVALTSPVLFHFTFLVNPLINVTSSVKSLVCIYNLGNSYVTYFNFYSQNQILFSE